MGKTEGNTGETQRQSHTLQPKSLTVSIQSPKAWTDNVVRIMRGARAREGLAEVKKCLSANGMLALYYLASVEKP